MAMQQESMQDNVSAEQSSQAGQQLERSQGATSVQRGNGPASILRRAQRDMDRLFHSFFGSSPFRWAEWAAPLEMSGDNGYWPEIEVQHSGNKLVVEADVPGLKKEDVKVEVRDNQLWISGERRTESEHREGQYFRSERSYGSFCRAIPLPDGAKAETASASFDNGVLKIEIEAPTAQRHTHRVEVRDGSTH